MSPPPAHNHGSSPTAATIKSVRQVSRFPSPTALHAWLELHSLDALSMKVVAVCVGLGAILGMAIWLPFAFGVALWVSVGLVYTTWFWCGPVLSRQPPTTRRLGFVVLAWAAGAWWWTVFVHSLWRHDIVRFNGDANVGRIAEFFIWHLLHLVPLVDIDEALKWQMPLGYDQAGIGACVLIYQTFIVIPVIALLRRAFGPRTPAADHRADPGPSP